MSNPTQRNTARAFACAFVLIAAVAWAQQTDDTLAIDQPVDHDVYAARSEVAVTSTVNGDVVAAGRQITIDGGVSGDVIAAAQSVEVRSSVNDDVRAVGQHVRIASPVSGHVVAAAQTVTVEQEIGDWAWLAGNTVDVSGDVGGDLKVRANEIAIDSEVAGDVELIGDELNLGPNTVIRGNVRWRSSNEATIDPGAQIDGEFIEEPAPGLVEELGAGGKYSLPINMIAAVMLLFALFSRALRASAERVAAMPFRLLLLGFVVMSVMPMLAIILLFSGVGFWLGFMVVLIFFVVLLLGTLSGFYVASDLALRKFIKQPAVWQSLAAIFVVVVAIRLLMKVPGLGFIILLAICLIGMGALCWNSWLTLRSVDGPEAQAP